MTWLNTCTARLICVLFVLGTNGIYFAMKRVSGRRAINWLGAAVLLLYAAMLAYGITRGFTQKDALLLLLSSLPCAFLPKGGSRS